MSCQIPDSWGQTGVCFGCFLLPELENKNPHGKGDTVLGGRAVSEELVILLAMFIGLQRKNRNNIADHI